MSALNDLVLSTRAVGTLWPTTIFMTDRPDEWERFEQDIRFFLYANIALMVSAIIYSLILNRNCNQDLTWL